MLLPQENATRMIQSLDGYWNFKVEKPHEEIDLNQPLPNTLKWRFQLHLMIKSSMNKLEFMVVIFGMRLILKFQNYKKCNVTYYILFSDPFS